MLFDSAQDSCHIPNTEQSMQKTVNLINKNTYDNQIKLNKLINLDRKHTTTFTMFTNINKLLES